MEQRELEAPQKKDKGFTLIELLIVIVILGILATVTVFAVQGITKSSKEATCKTEKAEVQTAVEAYYTEKGLSAYSFTTPDLVAASYFRSGLKGTYTIAADGKVTASAYPGVTDLASCNG